MGHDVYRLWSIVLLMLGFMTPGWSQAAPTPRQQEFALNNLTFALYHEVGHLLISEFNLPVLGKEEDAADNIATMLLLAQQAPQANKALMDSTQGWRNWAINPMDNRATELDKRLPLATLYNSHSPDLLRAGQIGCLMVGSRREVFATIALELGLDGGKREVCEHNLGQIIASWLVIKIAFIQSGPPMAPIEIIYDAAPKFEESASLLKSSGLMENVAAQILSHYALPRPVRLRATSCGQANAYFDPANAELLMCYELADFYLKMAGHTQD